MTYLRWSAVVEAGIFLFALAFLVGLLNGCAAAKGELAEQAYRSEQEDCLTRFSTKNERVTCVNQVRARWALDGGAD